MPCTIKNLFRMPFPLVAGLLLGLFCLTDAKAGNGYIDSQGKWHFSVVFVQPPPPATQIDENAWKNVLNIADTLLYRATNGKHQIGTVTFASRSHYDPLADIIIWRGANRSYAHVYGINRLGYHVYMSDLLREPDRESPKVLAKYLVHELGHYLYSLYDEYLDELESDLPPPPKCIDRAFKKEALDRAACLMESFWDKKHLNIETWCFEKNHEVTSDVIQIRKTWQSGQNRGRSCWSTIKDICSRFGDFPDKPQLPADVDMRGFVPMTIIEPAPHTELVVAVDANIMPDSPKEDRLLNILDRAFASHPESNSAIVFLSYHGGGIMASPSIPWDLNLIQESNGIPRYQSELNRIRPDNPSANASLEKLLQGAIETFTNLSQSTGGITAVSRTLLIITSGTESATMPNETVRKNFRAQNIRTSISFVDTIKYIPTAIIDTYRETAAGIHGAIYDATAPDVRAFQAADAANKQIVAVRTDWIPSPGNSARFKHKVLDNIAESIVSVSWPDHTCDLAVKILLNERGSPVAKGQGEDIVARALKARRYLNLAAGDRLEVEVTAPAGCQMKPLPVTFSISDEKPTVFLTVTSERPLYGRNDNQVVHAQVAAPYPLANLDTVVVGKINAIGEFINQLTDHAFDDGVERIRTRLFNGDWVKEDGIYSKILQGANVAEVAKGVLHTVRILVTNWGQAKLARGEKFSNAAPVNPIPKFRREAFVTYFVDAVKNSSLPEIQLAPLNIIDPRLRFTGSWKLASDYPRVYAITGEINGVSLKFDADRFKLNLKELNFDPSKPKLNAVIKVYYRTGDSTQVAINFPSQ